MQAANDTQHGERIVFELGAMAATINLSEGVLDLSNASEPISIYDGAWRRAGHHQRQRPERGVRGERGDDRVVHGRDDHRGEQLLRGPAWLRPRGGHCQPDGLRISMTTPVPATSRAAACTMTERPHSSTARSAATQRRKRGGGGLYNGFFGQLTATGCAITANSSVNEAQAFITTAPLR